MEARGGSRRGGVEGIWSLVGRVGDWDKGWVMISENNDGLLIMEFAKK